MALKLLNTLILLLILLVACSIRYKLETVVASRVIQITREPEVVNFIEVQAQKVEITEKGFSEVKQTDNRR